MSLVNFVRSYSDIDLPDPEDYENGYKEALVARFGDADRMLSNPRTGERGPSTMDIEFIDDGRFRQQIAGRQTFWPGSMGWTVKMTSRANRAVKGDPYVVWVGPHVSSIPTWGGRQRRIKVTLGDMFTRLVSGSPGKDRGLIPWRTLGDGIANQGLGYLTSYSENLDLATPETILYGEFRRVPGIDPPSPQGFIVVPTLLGVTDVSGDAFYVWFLCGHATADIPDAYVTDLSVSPSPGSILADEGTEWLIPHHGGFNAQFGAVYQDFVDIFGRTRRYTLLYGKVTDPFADPASMTDPDACAAGHKQLSVAVDGTEPSGEGTDPVITDGFEQRKHFMINYVANMGPESYHSGAYLANPTWDVFGVPVEKVHEASHDDAAAIVVSRLPPDGYVRAWVIGRTSSDRNQADTWRAAFDRSLGCMSGPSRFCQDMVVMCHPTQEDKDNADLFTDANEILLDTFGADVRWPLHANAIPFKGDLNPATGVHATTDTATWDPSIEEWDQIDSEPIEYPGAPGITQLFHLAHLEVLRSQQPPIFIELQTTIVEQDASSLAYKELGDYITYRHKAAVANAEDEIRLAQIIAMQVQVGARRVKALALDVDDLIGYDEPPTT